MRTAFVAIWYDRAKVEDRARKAGWKEEEGGLLDIYNPEEDPRGYEKLECPDLKSAETHLRNVIAEGKEFWGQAIVREFEVNGPRCKYCTCHGWKCIREYVVEENGVTDQYPQDDCADDDE
jgi:hypothetical protein